MSTSIDRFIIDGSDRKVEGDPKRRWMPTGPDEDGVGNANPEGCNQYKKCGGAAGPEPRFHGDTPLARKAGDLHARYLGEFERDKRDIQNVFELTDADKRAIKTQAEDLKAEYGGHFIRGSAFKKSKVDGHYGYADVGLRRVDGVLGLLLDSDAFFVADGRLERRPKGWVENSNPEGCNQHKPCSGGLPSKIDSRGMSLQDKNAMANRLRKECETRFGVGSPYRINEYIKLRMRGKTPDEAIAKVKATRTDNSDREPTLSTLEPTTYQVRPQVQGLLDRLTWNANPEGCNQYKPCTSEHKNALVAETERRFRSRTPAKKIDEVDPGTRVNRSEIVAFARHTLGVEPPLPGTDDEYDKLMLQLYDRLRKEFPEERWESKRKQTSATRRRRRELGI